MTPLAHVGGVPVEELLPWLVPGTGLALARAWVALHQQRRKDRSR
ncbi:MAG TPA: hypothetical protein VFX85_04960 [Solirubrobacterales bacterium]|nr:hypothetical protein [Solirubrobacterales bacterium]